MLIESALLFGGAAKIINDLKTSDELNEQARKKNIRALSRVAEAQIEQKDAEATMNQEILRLYNRKKLFFQLLWILSCIYMKKSLKSILPKQKEL